MRFIAFIAVFFAILAFVTWITVLVEKRTTAMLAVAVIPGKRFISKSHAPNPFAETAIIVTVVAISNGWVKYHYGDAESDVFSARPIEEFVTLYVPYN